MFGPILRLYLSAEVLTKVLHSNLNPGASNLEVLQPQGWSQQLRLQMPSPRRLQLPANVWKRRVRRMLLVPRHQGAIPRIKHLLQSEGNHRLQSIGPGLC